MLVGSKSVSRLTGAVEEVVTLEEYLAGSDVESRVEVANGDFLASENLMKRAHPDLLAFEEDVGVGVAGVVDHGRGQVEGIPDRLFLGRRTKADRVGAHLWASVSICFVIHPREPEENTPPGQPSRP